MAKEKQTRRMIAMTLAAAVTMSSVPVVAFAEEGGGDNPSVTQNADGTTTTTTKTESGDGTVNAPKVTLTVSETKDADGNTTSTVTTTETKIDNDKTGDVTTDKTETKTETVTPNATGTTTETVTYLDQTVVDDKGTATKSDDKTVVADVDSESTVEKAKGGKVLSDEGYEEGTETTTDVYSPETSVPIINSDNTTGGSDTSKTEITETTDETTGVTTKAETITTSVTDPETGVTTITTTIVTTITTPSDVEDGEPAVTTSTETKVTTSASKTEGPDLDKEDGEWDFTEITETGREVTVKVDPEKIEIFNGDGTVTDQNGNVIEIGSGDNNGDGVVNEKDGFLPPVQQVWKGNEEGLWTGYNDERPGSVYYDDEDGRNPDRYIGIVEDRPIGGDVAFTGWGEEAAGSYWLSYKAYNYVQDVNADGTPKVDEVGNPVYKQLIDEETNQPVVDENGNPVYERKQVDSGSSFPINFVLSDVQKVPVMVQGTNADGSPMVDENNQPVMVQKVDKNGQPVYENQMVGPQHTTYCVDLTTGAVHGEWYQMNNLENSGYYDEERADNIRAIVNNGYWGTLKAGDFADDATKYEKGSLTDVVNKLQAAYDDAVKNEKDFPLTADEVKDIVDNLNEGEALTATQMAIWQFGNGWDEVELNANTSRVNNLAKYLTSLSEPEGETTKVIKEDQFIESMDFVVGDKVEEHANNLDADDNNDAYDVEVKFALVVQPDEKDNLVVKVVDANNNVVASGRIAGNNADGETYDTLTPDVDGNYTLSGLKLVENEDVEFSLKLEGAQYLESGVYIYTSVDNYDSSQTFVGLGEGYQTVDVGMAVNMTFDVKEGTITKKHSWRKTWHDEPENDPSGGGKDPETPKDPEDPKDPKHPGDPGNPEDFEDIGDNDVPLAGVDPEEPVDISDEDVPLAAADEEVSVIAETGDSNHMTGAFGGMFAALVGMFMLRKKKEN